MPCLTWRGYLCVCVCMYSPIIIRAVQFVTWPLHPPGRILHSELSFEVLPLLPTLLTLPGSSCL